LQVRSTQNVCIERILYIRWERNKQTVCSLISYADGLRFTTVAHEVRWACVLSRRSGHIRTVADPFNFRRLSEIHYFRIAFNVCWPFESVITLFISTSDFSSVPTASEVTTLWRDRNVCIIIIIITAPMSCLV